MMRNTNLGPALDAFVHPQKHCRTFFLVCVCVHGSVVTHGGTRSQPHTSSCRRHMIEGPYKFGCSPKQGKTTPVVCIFKRPLLCLFFFFILFTKSTTPIQRVLASPQPQLLGQLRVLVSRRVPSLRSFVHRLWIPNVGKHGTTMIGGPNGLNIK